MMIIEEAKTQEYFSFVALEVKYEATMRLKSHWTGEYTTGHTVLDRFKRWVADVDIRRMHKTWYVIVKLRIWRICVGDKIVQRQKEGWKVLFRSEKHYNVERLIQKT